MLARPALKSSAELDGGAGRRGVGGDGHGHGAPHTGQAIAERLARAECAADAAVEVGGVHAELYGQLAMVLMSLRLRPTGAACICAIMRCAFSSASVPVPHRTGHEVMRRVRLCVFGGRLTLTTVLATMPARSRRVPRPRVRVGSRPATGQLAAVQPVEERIYCPGDLLPALVGIKAPSRSPPGVLRLRHPRRADR